VPRARLVGTLHKIIVKILAREAPMHLHFLGICGTFMGSLALLAREMGFKVTGCDENIYPPMSTQLEEQGVEIHQGFDASQFSCKPDLVIIGNAMSRGNEAVEYVLNNQLPYTSGPQWLSENLLAKRWVLAVAGTHGKTTTTSMLAWILEHAGMEPGFLIGGVPAGFTTSASLGKSDFFVIEADEYDTAFFDKRSKFVHYHPRTLIMNNLEFDHADIFDNISDIQKQFQHLLKIIPSQGRVIYPEGEKYIEEVVERGVWSELVPLKSDAAEFGSSEWQMHLLKQDASELEIRHCPAGGPGKNIQLGWNLIGEHNAQNAFAACVAAHHVGVPLEQSIQALESFRNVKRRLELLLETSNKGGKQVRIFDDFAHHPTAIETTLSALRSRYPDNRIVAVLEPRSNTMKMGVHGDRVREACKQADLALWYIGENQALDAQLESSQSQVFASMDELSLELDEQVQMSDRETTFVFMSNGGFSGIQRQFADKLKSRIDDT